MIESGEFPESSSKTATAKLTVSTLRSLLRFFYLEGITPTAMAPAVLAVAPWRQSSLPKALDAGVVTRLLKSCDRRTASGARDFAVLMLLSRLGLRASEVAGLQPVSYTHLDVYKRQDWSCGTSRPRANDGHER